MFGQILTSQTGGQLYSDISPYEVSECSLPWLIRTLHFESLTQSFFSRQWSVSVTRFGKISSLWQNFKSLWQFLKLYPVFGKIFNLLWTNFLCFWTNFHCLKWQKMKTNLFIWSHWSVMMNDLWHDLWLWVLRKNTIWSHWMKTSSRKVCRV